MPIESVKIGCYKIPTDGLEADGTIQWDHTTLVTAEIQAQGVTGFGYTYSHRAAAVLAQDTLAELLVGKDEMNTARLAATMLHAVRNLGSVAISASAIACLDIALWDLKAKILGLPLVKLLGCAQDSIAVYGSGGFTSYDIHRLRAQASAWSEQGIKRIKMKVGSEPNDDEARVRAVREVIGDTCEIFVDANGAYSRKEALRFAELFQRYGVTWFEEPVPSDDLVGLRLLRDRAPAGMEIAAGEYGYADVDFRRMLEAEAVDVMQADATRCRGVSGFLAASVLSRSFAVPISAHTAPTVHMHTCCACENAVHLEYFYDHSRIEHLLFDGARSPRNGCLTPDLSRPGLGVEFKHRDAARFAWGM